MDPQNASGVDLRSLTFESLGGEVELFAYEPAEPLEATAEWIRGLHARLTRFEPDSELSRFNARAGEWVEVSPVLHDLLVASLRAFEESDGLVNVAVLPALIAAGYDRTFEEVRIGVGRGAWVPPTEARAMPKGAVSAKRSTGFLHRIDAKSHQNDAEAHRIGADAHRIGAEKRETAGDTPSPELPIAALPDLLQVVPGRALLARGAAIDLGGIAKGWIADRAVERLGPNSLVSCGGDLHARGGGESGEGWPIGFADRTLLLKDMAAATSGTAKRRWGDGQHHLIDPRTGKPSTSDLTEVSVLAGTALDAEIIAKTAFLLGSAKAEAYLQGRSKGWALS